MTPSQPQTAMAYTLDMGRQYNFPMFSLVPRVAVALRIQTVG